MSKFNSVLNARLGKKEKGPTTKMATLAEESNSGRLSSFAGVFSVTDLSGQEREELEQLLINHAEDESNISLDLNTLISITSEVKAITNQAALLHGERIKRAQVILKKYKEGAFTSWLITTYGNRQTPYNFLQYFEFYTSIPKTLRPQVERMPRQAVYTLASRDGELSKKEEIVKGFGGESKGQLLQTIREAFPLADGDGRRGDSGEQAINSLHKLYTHLSQRSTQLSSEQRQSINQLLSRLKKLTK
jgi:hypothetical protein